MIEHIKKYPERLIGFIVGLLQTAFFILKLTGFIEWSWCLVFLPALISLFYFVIILIAALVLFWDPFDY
jgi:hypothetical protein